MKEFGKSVNIWRSYGQDYGVLFFDLQCRPIVYILLIISDMNEDTWRCGQNLLSAPYYYYGYSLLSYANISIY